MTVRSELRQLNMLTVEHQKYYQGNGSSLGIFSSL